MEWKSILFQICFGLSVAQKNYNFVHNDLHSSNIMFKETELEFLYFQLFQALAPIPASSPCPKHIPQCLGQFLGSSGSLVLNVFFLRQKIHFGKMCMISWFSAVSGLGSITSVFSGSR